MMHASSLSEETNIKSIKRNPHEITYSFVLFLFTNSLTNQTRHEKQTIKGRLHIYFVL